MFNEIYFFPEHIRNYLVEKWSVAIQFPDDKNLIKQINTRKELQRFLKTFAISDETTEIDYVPKQIEDLYKVLNIIEQIQNCLNLTIYLRYKFYLDYVFISIVNSIKDDYEYILSNEIENRIINDIKTKEKKRIFRKIISFGFA
jgi:hypothetical protein